MKYCYDCSWLRYSYPKGKTHLPYCKIAMMESPNEKWNNHFILNTLPHKEQLMALSSFSIETPEFEPPKGCPYLLEYMVSNG